MRFLLATRLLLICTSIVSVPSIADTLAPAPYPIGEVIAGDNLLVLDADNRIWSRQLPVDEQSTWRILPLPRSAEAVGGLYCAPDGSGLCAVGLNLRSGPQIGLISKDAEIEQTGIPASYLFGFTNSRTLYFARRRDGHTAVYGYDVPNRVERFTDDLQNDEVVDMVTINGQLTLIARGPDGNVRTLEPNHPKVSSPDVPSDAVNSRFGMLYAQSWAKVWTSHPQVQNLILFEFKFDGNGQLSRRYSSLGSLPITSPLIDDGSLVSDFAGDLFGTATSADGRFIVAFCNDRSGKRNAGQLARIHPGVAVRLVASAAGNGVLVIESSPGQAPVIGMFQFAKPSPRGFQSRTCENASVEFHDIGVESETAAKWIASKGFIAAPDGTRLSYVLLSPKDRSVEHLLINAYGAYGRVLPSESLTPAILDHLFEERTAIAFVKVRGDGDAGIAAAMASRTPNRQLAVNDLISLTKDIVRQIPSLNDLPTVEGKSAGAWLAMEAALQHPELYAGAIGFSGAYLFADKASVSSKNAFFAPSDSFDRNGVLGRAHCSQQHFRIIHAVDDPVLDVEQARRFAGMLKEHGCHGELVLFNSGGHKIEVRRRSQSADRLIGAYFTAFVNRHLHMAGNKPPKGRDQR